MDTLAACSLIASALLGGSSIAPCCTSVEGTTTSLYRLGKLPSTRKPSSSALDHIRICACHSAGRSCLGTIAGSISPALSTTRWRSVAMEVKAALASLSMASEAAKTCDPISGTMCAKWEDTVWSARSTRTLPPSRPGCGTAHAKP